MISLWDYTVTVSSVDVFVCVFKMWGVCVCMGVVCVFKMWGVGRK